jgi:hypothetical protein
MIGWLVCFTVSFFLPSFLLSLFGINKYMAVKKSCEDHSAISEVEMRRHT